MRKNYINQIPLPTCVVDKEGTVIKSNPLMKNVFVYEDIVGSKFFTLTGVRRDDLARANENELIIERNDRIFKIRTNQDVKEDADITVFFDEATARETFRSKLEKERAVIVFINIDNYDDLIANTGEDGRRALPSQIDSIVRKWADSYDSPVISTDDERYVMYTNHEKLEAMAENGFSAIASSFS